MIEWAHEAKSRMDGVSFPSSAIKVRKYTLLNCKYIAFVVTMDRWMQSVVQTYRETNAQDTETIWTRRLFDVQTWRKKPYKPVLRAVDNKKQINKYYAFTGKLRHQWMLPSEQFTHLAQLFALLLFSLIFLFFPFQHSFDKTSGNYSTNPTVQYLYVEFFSERLECFAICNEMLFLSEFLLLSFFHRASPLMQWLFRCCYWKECLKFVRDL